MQNAARRCCALTFPTYRAAFSSVAQAKRTRAYVTEEKVGLTPQEGAYARCLWLRGKIENFSIFSIFPLFSNYCNYVGGDTHI